MSALVRLFVSYAHEDDFWKQRLMTVLRFPGVRVKAWNDKDVETGRNWDQDIRRELEEMDVFIPLVSVHFAVSHYITKVECPIAIKRREEIEIAPIFVSDPGKDECGWLRELQWLPPGRKFWAENFREFQHADLSLAPIRDGLKQVVERARKRK